MGRSPHLQSVSVSLVDGRVRTPQSHLQLNKPVLEPEHRAAIHIAVVACGNHGERALVTLKSAVMMSQSPLHFHIFSDDAQTHKEMTGVIQLWRDAVNGRVTYSTHDVQYPAGENANAWKGLFKKCATVRLFLSDVLHIDSVLYVDSDVLFVTPVESIWNLFKRFNSTQFASMTPEHEAKAVGWYNRFGKHPYFGKTGLNSGVMLMNLTRIRLARFMYNETSQSWSKYVVALYHKYRNVITWGDQDLLNIVFHFYPERLFVHNCMWNYRPDHCMHHPLGKCAIAETKATIHLLHGNRQAFLTSRWEPFQAVYKAYLKQSAESIVGNLSSFVRSVQDSVSTVRGERGCAKMVPMFEKYFQKLLN